MKAGDLVKIKYDGTLTVVKKIEGDWVHLHDEEVSFSADKLEVVSCG